MHRSASFLPSCSGTTNALGCPQKSSRRAIVSVEGESDSCKTEAGFLTFGLAVVEDLDGAPAGLFGVFTISGGLN